MPPARLWFLACVLVAALLQSAFAGERTSFIYQRANTDDLFMHGDLSDLERVRKALKPRDRVLWTRTESRKEYLIRDPATLDAFEKAWAPAEVLSRQLGELGKQQGKLGEQQGKLGEQQGKLGERQGKLEQKLESLDSDDTVRRAPIEREMRELEAKMAELEKQMRVFEKPMRELEKQMRALEPKHDAAAKQAQAATDALVARAIASGVAKPF